MVVNQSVSIQSVSICIVVWQKVQLDDVLHSEQS
jgi:hypothetical protein